MTKQGKIDTFFSKKRTNQADPVPLILPSLAADDENREGERVVPNIPPASSSKRSKNVESGGIDLNSLELDPGLRRQIWKYPSNEQDDVRRAYLSCKPYQPQLTSYPFNTRYYPPRRFQASWYDHFKWLEYSPTKDKAFCKPCFIFNKPSDCANRTTFTIGGFDNWKYVRSGKTCTFLGHEGGIGSFHHNAEMACHNLMNKKQHISRVIETFTSEEIASNRVRVTASIVLVRLLALQGLTFRGHDERLTSLNRGNFLEFLDVLAIYNEELATSKALAPKNAKYVSHGIQLQILNVISERVKIVIREEIGNSKYCVLVDEARDESKREQMSIVLRFVDKKGFIQERFFGVVHVPNTTSLTLKDAIYSVLAHYQLDVQNI